MSKAILNLQLGTEVNKARGYLQEQKKKKRGGEPSKNASCKKNDSQISGPIL